MSSSLRKFKARAFAKPGVRKAYGDLRDEFSLLDAILRARTAAGLTQAQVAARIGTTQSAVARLESADAKHSPSIATLRRYARAVGCRIEVRFVKEATAPRYAAPTRATRPRRAKT